MTTANGNTTSLPIVNREPAPCHRGCPAGIDVARYIGYVALGKFSEATAVVRERIPFPSVCGYICYRPCETVCRRGLWESPVAINAIKDAAVRRDTELWRERFKDALAEPSGKRVAVVGSGPAGLTAAYYLGKRCGHEVTVFEAESKAGGQLRIGVPPNRLPREAVNREIEILSETRVDIRTGRRVEDLEALMQEGFDACFLAVGTCIPRNLGIPGEELPGVMKGVSFLKQANLGVETQEFPELGKRVAIIGAGNVAVDCARSATRLGATDVRVLYRRSRKEMPAYDFEMRAAEIEGAKVEFLVRPERIETNGEALVLHLTRMTLGDKGPDGRAVPVPIEGSGFELSVDNVLIAIGQTPTVPEGWTLERNPDGTIAVADGSLQTTRDGFFAGGDVVSGPQNIIEAIAHGRRAASEIDRYLGGPGDLTEVLAPPPGEEMAYPDIHPHGKECVPMSELPKDERIQSFEPALLGYSEAEAKDEARRCVRCDLWSLRGAPRVWWERRGLKPYWHGGVDRRSREKDAVQETGHGPYSPRFDHAPFVPEEYVHEESDLLRPSRYGDDVIEHYRQSGFWTEDTTVSLLQAKAAARPDAIAVSDSTTRRTWSELLDEAERVASGLLQLGLDRGEPVVIQLPNWVESIALRYALKMAGLIAIYAPVTWRAQEIRQVLEKTGARLLVASPKFHQLDFAAMTADLQSELEGLRSVFVRGETPALEGACSWESLTRSGTRTELCPTKAEEVSLICVSSGSTGTPKLCETPEAAQLVNGRGIAERFEMEATDVVGIFAPSDGGAGLMGWLIAAATGCPVVLADDFQPQAMLDRIAAERVSVLATVPALLIRLLQPDLGDRDLSALRLIRTGTAALTPATAREAERRFGAKLVPAAGTMEVLTYAQTGLLDPETVRGASVGCPLPGNEARVVSDDGDPLPSGELGVLEVRGAGTGSGYYKDRKATREAWDVDAWFRTGDLAVIDGAGYIRLRGRTKDVISRGGRNIFPAELEALLMEHENVQEVAVVGVENTALGECARAYIVKRGQTNLTESELRAFLETKQIATYKIPDEFRFLTELPRLPGAKVNRRALKAEA